LRETLMGNVAVKVLTVLSSMDSVGLNLPLFLDFLSWGDQECVINAKIRYARTALMVSAELPGILECWRNLPWAPGSTDTCSKAAQPVIEEFALSCIAQVVEKELQGVGESMCPADKVSDTGLTCFLIKDMTLNGSLQIVLSVIFQLLFAWSQHHNCWPKFVTTFLHAQGISAKLLDLLHAFGSTMSHKWSVHSFNTMSTNALEKVCQKAHTGPFVLSHDNVNIPFHTFSQRLNKQSHFDSGMAATVYFQPNTPPEPPLSNRTLQQFHEEGRKHPLTIHEIFELEVKSAASQYEHDICCILQYHTGSPKFDLKTYEHKDHQFFSPLTLVEKLPCGPQFITEQHILSTVHIEEASYKGNEQLIMEWFKQLHLHTKDERKQTGLEQVIIWVGDQLTVKHLCGLFKYYVQDHMSFD
ncbi:hypothetical protein PAXRUDRAFT_162190, partial [Paxillus rubicundulus Ve08.2h10]